jgi:hypothetical protein
VGKPVLKASVPVLQAKTIAKVSAKISKMTLSIVVPVALCASLEKSVQVAIVLLIVPQAHPRIAPVHALTCKQTSTTVESANNSVLWVAERLVWVANVNANQVRHSVHLLTNASIPKPIATTVANVTKNARLASCAPIRSASRAAQHVHQKSAVAVVSIPRLTTITVETVASNAPVESPVYPASVPVLLDKLPV